MLRADNQEKKLATFAENVIDLFVKIVFVQIYADSAFSYFILYILLMLFMDINTSLEIS